MTLSALFKTAAQNSSKQKADAAGDANLRKKNDSLINSQLRNRAGVAAALARYKAGARTLDSERSMKSYLEADPLRLF